MTMQESFVAMQESFVTCFKKYADFNGRATRSEYWWFMLGAVIIYIITSLLSSVLYGLAVLVLLLPSLSACVRRLHDIGKSGWWCLLSLVPIVGLFLLYWLAQPTQQGANQFGEAPAL